MTLPGGGSIAIPERYTQLQAGERVVTFYRNLRHNMGGARVCDGFVVAAGPGQFST